MALSAWIPFQTLQIRLGSHPRKAPGVSNQKSPPRRSSISRRAVLAALLAATAPSLQADAVCGDTDPYFAHFIEWREDFAKATGDRKVHFRLVGSRKNETKSKKYPVVYIGDAGVGISSGETLELLAGDRRVLFTDILGVGDSEPSTVAKTSRSELVEQARDEVRSAIKSAGFTKGTKLHFIAAGFGIEVAEALMKRLPEDGVGVLSVAVEGWAPIKDDVLFENLQGNRSCAVEGAQSGNLELARSIYGGERNRGAACEAVRRLSQQIPTMGLRTTDYSSPALQDTGPNYVEKAIKGNERLAHLANTEECLNVLDGFFVGVEGDMK